MSTPRLLVSLILAAIFLPVATAQAQERLCDSAFEDCRTPLWQLIDNETQGIDVAFWFMQDSSYATKLINKFKAGVPVRVIVDPRANPTYAGNEDVLTMLKDAGIPMRYKLTDGIVHWKLMLFVGQGKLEFSGANYSGNFFVPDSPHVNYMDEAIYFTDDVSIIQSFKTKYDDVWTNTVDYGNFANVTNQQLARKYPVFPINPELNFPPSQDWTQDFLTRTQQRFNAETQKIDVIMYRITNQGFSDVTINAAKRGIPVRLIHEPDEYRNPARQWDSWNVDRMYMAGVQIKMRKHLGLNHQKSVLLYGQGMTIFGSSNWTGPSSNWQLEHNLFTTKQWFFNWFVNQFERKWNSTTENEVFVPLPPQQPNYVAPANTATAQPTTIKLQWEGGQWAHKYDIYLGTTPNPPLLVADVSTLQSGAQPGQPLLDSGSVDDGHTETYTLPTALQPGTTYFWKIVGKTMANVTTSGPVWSFTTAGSSPGGSAPLAPAGLTAIAASSTQINLTWNDVANETEYRLERGPAASGPWTEIANLAANTTSFGNTGLTPQQTYFYRLRAGNSSGFSPYSDLASATTPAAPAPSANDVVLYAAEAPVKVGWSVAADGTAAGGSRLSNTDAGAPKKGNPAANPAQYFEMTFNAAAGVNYRLWLRSKAQGDLWSNDSVFVQFSDSVDGGGAAVYRIGTTSATEMNLEDCSGCGLQGWGWQDNGWGVGVLGPLVRFATSGSHTIRIQVREDGLSIDQIVLSPQTYLNTAPGPLKNDNTLLPKSGGTGGGGPTAPAPTVSSVTPNSGPTAGGTSVTISGSGFVSGATVSLGGTAATNVAVTNANTITATTGARTAGVVDVVVTNPDTQMATLAQGFTYTAPVATAPTVSGVNPTSGPTAGGTVITISGTGFAAGATVSLGGTAATNVAVTNANTITATTGARTAGVVDVVVTNPDTQMATLAQGFTYTAPVATAPTVSGVNPTSGPTAGGTVITISGTGFAAGATVNVGGSAATGVVVSNSTTITATTPAHVAGTVDVVVTNSNGQNGGKLNAFTYTAPAGGGETVLLADDFNDGSLDTSKWVANNLFSGFTDSTVAINETNSVAIGPLKQNTDGSHYNGIRSATAFDFTNGYTYVRLVQGPNPLTAADAFFTLGLNVDNCYRMYVESGNLIMQKKIAGAKSTMLTVTFNATSHAFWRMRHDAISGQIVFEVAPNNAGAPGSWTMLFSEPWNANVPLNAVGFELKAGTWRVEGANPGTVIFDTFKAARP